MHQLTRNVSVARLIGFKVARAVFGLSDTTGPEILARPTPNWDLERALEKLGKHEAPFDLPDGNMQGYSHGLEFAINPIAVNRTKTVFAVRQPSWADGVSGGSSRVSGYERAQPAR